MAGGGITGKAFSLETLFHGRTTYAIEYYQREYAWGADEVRTLLTDLVEEFERTGSIRRTRWTSPPEFFLGPFVYADEHNDRRFLVDGQQRFTTLHLIFLHLLRIAPDNAHRKTKDRLTFAVVAGYDGERTRFRLDIDERQRAMDALLANRPFELRHGDSLTVQNLWRRSEQIADELPQLLDTDQHGPFVDWLLDRVVMVGIEATDRDSGFRIFESMNDRGTRLSSVDLMKSYLLSRANRDQEKLNILWRDMIAEVTRQRGDTSAPNQFLKAYLIGRHADLSDNADAQKITDTPHIWVRDNPEKLGLNQDGEPYHAFVTDLIDLGRAYGDLVAATVRPYHENESAALYYNRINGVTAQMALILAAIQRGDTPSTIRAKARVAANFVDLLVVHRAIHDESTRPDDLNRAVLDAVPLVRYCNSAEELGAVLGAQLPQLDFDAIPGFGLRGDNRAQVRYILARLTAYVQQAMDQENIIERYLAEERAWHIEHLFPDHPDWHPDLTARQFRAIRNRIGGLGLLSAPDNTSVRDLPYEKKITWYRRHNALLAVLSAGYQQRNPGLRTPYTSGIPRNSAWRFPTRLKMRTPMPPLSQSRRRPAERRPADAAPGSPHSSPVDGSDQEHTFTEPTAERDTKPGSTRPAGSGLTTTPTDCPTTPPRPRPASNAVQAGSSGTSTSPTAPPYRSVTSETTPTS